MEIPLHNSTDMEIIGFNLTSGSFTDAVTLLCMEAVFLCFRPPCLSNSLCKLIYHGLVTHPILQVCLLRIINVHLQKISGKAVIFISFLVHQMLLGTL